jgi:hypothetical protein
MIIVIPASLPRGQKVAIAAGDCHAVRRSLGENYYAAGDASGRGAALVAPL